MIPEDPASSAPANVHGLPEEGTLLDAAEADNQLDATLVLPSSHGRTSDSLQTEACDVAQPSLAPDKKRPRSENKALTPGTVVGAYTLVSELGKGGMGTVWLARQSVPIKRDVALKFISLHMQSQEVLLRFEAERQALAMMNHPNIASILDAGTTAFGQPYFAMELVQGMPLTAFCDHHRLDINERLKLFSDVCFGVQHAHQKGIIHRDLKPSNILVGMVDGVPIPKVIDFGLAKALDAGKQLTEQSGFTGIGQILGTLKYMSPEQASLDGVDIDTRTDIYSLGIVLYELLTGDGPLDDESIRKHAALTLLELIRQREAPKPSSRLGSGTAEQISTITQARRIDSVRLGRLLSGDLDWIVMRALEKDRSRRYQSASGFADDVNRYLHGDPVEARPPSFGYRVRKFAKKNRTSVAAAGLLVASLLLGVMGTSVGLYRAIKAESLAEERFEQGEVARKQAEDARAQEAERAEGERIANELAQQRLVQLEKGNQLLAGLFDDLNITNIRDSSQTLQEVLTQRLLNASELLEGDSIGDPLIVAGLQQHLGQALTSLGSPQEAIRILRKLVATRTDLLGKSDPLTLAAMNDLAAAIGESGDRAGSVEIFKAVLEGRKNLLGPTDVATIRSMSNLASAYKMTGKIHEALPLHEQALSLMQQAQGENNSFIAAIMTNLALNYQAVGQMDKAMPLFEKSATLSREVHGENHLSAINADSNLAYGFVAIREFDRALPVFEQALARANQSLGKTHPLTLTIMNNLATVYWFKGDLASFVPMTEQTLALRKLKLGPTHPETLATMANLAVGDESTGQLERAMELHKQIYSLHHEHLGIKHPNTLTCLNNWARCCQTAGQYNLAIEKFTKTLELSEINLGLDHPDTLATLQNLSSVYWETNNPYAAMPLLEEHLRRTIAKFGYSSDEATERIAFNGARYCILRKYFLAIPLLERGATAKRDIPGNSMKLLDSYCQSGDRDTALLQAEKMLLESEQIMLANLGEHDVLVSEAAKIEAMARMLAETGIHFEAAEAMYQALQIRMEIAPNAWETQRTRDELDQILAAF
jgi:eukaryotic-like serine/threonine-protein kinase